MYYCRYEADPDRRDRFFYTMLGGCGPAPESCTPDVVRIVVLQHLSCPSVWAIFPIQVRKQGGASGALPRRGVQCKCSVQQCLWYYDHLTVLVISVPRNCWCILCMQGIVFFQFRFYSCRFRTLSTTYGQYQGSGYSKNRIFRQNMPIFRT